MAPFELIPLLQKKPFEPFRIVSSDGKSYDIRHPELVIPFSTTVAVLSPNPEKPGAFLGQEFLSMYHILRVEPLAAVTKGNGEQ